MDVVRKYDAVSSPSAVTSDIYLTNNKMPAWKTKPANETFFCDTKPMSPLIGCHLGINAGILGKERNPPIIVKQDLVSDHLRSTYQTMDITTYESVHETETHDMSSCDHALDGVLAYLSGLKQGMGSTGLNTQAMEKRSFDEVSAQELRPPDRVGTQLDIGPISNIKEQETSCPSEIDQSVSLRFKPADKEIMTSSRTHQACHCCSHLPKSSPSHFPAFGLQNQRPSVIMVPVKWKETVTPESSKDGSVLSDADDQGEAQPLQYFRKKIDRTTARFKLSKSDWERIPINTFPSGGRLLSGDWTRIFLSKVKESNPWCSLRFKNNHVRSENSRKIHSAVFFRGGAECKRPECSVKVRFVIRKEKGKYVDVTYVGDVCHSNQPGGSDVMDNKNRKKLSKACRRS